MLVLLASSPDFAGSPQPCPLVLSKVAAGFPSPADDYLDQSLDLNSHLVTHPAATFFVRVEGESMIGAGIHDGDILVVDRARPARAGDIVVAVINGDLTVKRLAHRDAVPVLLPENPNYPPIVLGEGTEATLWGVVAHAIHSF